MTPHDLLSAFETLAEAPDGITRLHELVLQLAVRGQIVPHDPTDEPAYVLLERSAAEKAQPVKNRKIPKPKSLPPASEDEVLFAVPEGWAPVRLVELGFFVGGKTPSKARLAFWTSSIPWVSAKDMKASVIVSSEDEGSQAAIG